MIMKEIEFLAEPWGQYNIALVRLVSPQAWKRYITYPKQTLVTEIMPPDMYPTHPTSPPGRRN